MQEVEFQCERGKIAGLRMGNPSGAKVLALHGWLDNAASFLPIAPYLQQFDLVALDLPGHGKSDHRAPGYDYVFVDWVHDVLDVLDALEWPRAHILGHSMGGAIASLLAAGQSDRLLSLTMIEALGALAGSSKHAARRWHDAVSTRRHFKLKMADQRSFDLNTAVRARLAATPMTAEDAELIVQRNLIQTGDDLYQWRSDRRLRWPTAVRLSEETAQSLLRAITLPTLLIAADPPSVFMYEAIRDQRLACLPQAQRHVLTGGHHLHMEQPLAVASIIAQWLPQHDAAL